MKRILVGVDGSDESKAALQEAVRLAQATQSTLELAHVLPDLTEPILDSSRPRPLLATERAQHGHLLLEGAAHAVSGVAVNVSLLEGRPADRLAAEAKRPEIWMVVVGHRGRGALQRTVRGSVADSLTQISPKPVLVVR